MDYSQKTQTRATVAEKPQTLFRLALLVFGSLISLTLVLNLLNISVNFRINSANYSPKRYAKTSPSSALAPNHRWATHPSTTATPTPHWLTIPLAQQSPLAVLRHSLHLSQQDIQQILSLPQAYIALKLAPPAQTFSAIVDPNHHVREIRYPYGTDKTLLISQQGRNWAAQVQQGDSTLQLEIATNAIQTSLANAVKSVHLQPRMTEQLARIFSDKIDFARALRRGDHFTVIFQQQFHHGKPTGKNKILAAEFVNRGKIYQAILDDLPKGNDHYYTPSGRSLKNAFLRAPVHYQFISSSFSLHRYHPILHRYRPHYGVDLAANKGTPIHAASNGRIYFIGKDGGFGNVIKMQNTPKIQTFYAHMWHFAKGLHVGSHVKEGQVIGYVGQTGLATGPHLHYEFHLNGYPVNPMTVKLPSASPVPIKQRTAFKDYAKTLVEQLQVYDEKYWDTDKPSS